VKNFKRMWRELFKLAGLDYGRKKGVNAKAFATEQDAWKRWHESHTASEMDGANQLFEARPDGRPCFISDSAATPASGELPAGRPTPCRARHKYGTMLHANDR
jgi:hypothetical protein